MSVLVELAAAFKIWNFYNTIFQEQKMLDMPDLKSSLSIEKNWEALLNRMFTTDLLFF